MKLKKLEDQVIVLTGATSGIGLVTARMAAKRGARLMLVARNVEALVELTQELNRREICAKFISGDVASEADMAKVAAATINAFGTFDTWINNAGVSIYGKLVDISDSDSRQLFDTNFWGVVNGSLVAAKHLKQAGGAIINVGSTLSDRAIPIQGMYCASKHAVKGFTDALRMELEYDEAPISVTLIKPSAIDTPYKEHAKNYLGVQPENPPPVYAPQLVAETILHCAENPVRDCFVGAGGKALSFAGYFAPRITDYIMENTMVEMQHSDKKKNAKNFEGLYESKDSTLNERGGYDGHVSESSLYTKASLHPIRSGVAVIFGIGAAILAGRELFKHAPARASGDNELQPFRAKAKTQASI